MGGRTKPSQGEKKDQNAKSFRPIGWIVATAVVLVAGIIIGVTINSPPSKEVTAPEIVPKGANAEGRPREASSECLDRHAECKAFLRNGECQKNPGWMIINCPLSCRSCHLRDPVIRCARTTLNMTLEPVYKPGDMNSLFAGLQQRYGSTYNVNILSTSPWIATFDNFVSEKEMTALINTQNKWERSTDTGVTNEFGETGRILSQGRTSTNAWCTEECMNHKDVKSVMAKIEEVTHVPRTNYESFQVLRYEEGQKYVAHHDFGHDDVKLACGPRILTFFLYLSDVEEGGETAFPLLNISVRPKRGRALLWPSVLDENLEHIDTRTTHEAKPVIKGRKFAANAWIHLFDYAKPNLWGCTGSFDEL